MEAHVERRIRARPERVFDLAARVEDWPRILPHYRWVRTLATISQTERRVEMAARRDIVGRIGIPLRWVSIQRVKFEQGRIEFEHVAGITRGMQVAWTIETSGSSETLATIHHAFMPAWPLPDSLVQLVVGEYFVNAVARRTLRHIGLLAEADKTGR